MTENIAGLVALAERCECAAGPDRSLDVLIVEAFGWKRKGGFWSGSYWERGAERLWLPQIPKWTDSFDAAMTLVPEGHVWQLSQEDSSKPSRRWFAELRRGHKTSYDKAFPAWSATPALALCTAALRARASLSQGEGVGNG